MVRGCGAGVAVVAGGVGVVVVVAGGGRGRAGGVPFRGSGAEREWSAAGATDVRPP